MHAPETSVAEFVSNNPLSVPSKEIIPSFVRQKKKKGKKKKEGFMKHRTGVQSKNRPTLLEEDLLTEEAGCSSLLREETIPGSLSLLHIHTTGHSWLIHP